MVSRHRELFLRYAATQNLVLRKACFGGTPKPTRETRVLPGEPGQRPRLQLLRAFFESSGLTAQMREDFTGKM
jgi:hypothetical protein